MNFVFLDKHHNTPGPFSQTFEFQEKFEKPWKIGGY